MATARLCAVGFVLAAVVIASVGCGDDDAGAGATDTTRPATTVESSTTTVAAGPPTLRPTDGVAAGRYRLGPITYEVRDGWDAQRGDGGIVQLARADNALHLLVLTVTDEEPGTLLDYMKGRTGLDSTPSFDVAADGPATLAGQPARRVQLAIRPGARATNGVYLVWAGYVLPPGQALSVTAASIGGRTVVAFVEAPEPELAAFERGPAADVVASITPA
jgi:hypothetical protein